MAQAVEGVKNSQVQAVAFHMYAKCKEQTAAFEACVASADKPSAACAEEFKAVAACAKDL